MTGLAAGTLGAGSLSELAPPTTNIEASSGRASSRETVMPHSYPIGCTATAPGGVNGSRTWHRRPSVRRTSLAGMCGRYASSRQPEDLVEEFEITLVPDHVPRIEADWNVAPTKEVYAVVERPPRDEDGTKAEEPERQLRVLTWGLVPFWSKDPSGASRMINARMETVAEKPAYRRAVRAASLPAAGRRLLRVVRHRAADREGQAAQAAVLHPPARRRACSRWPGSTRSGATRRRPTTTLTGSGGRPPCSPPAPRTRSATSTTGCR